MFNNEIFPLHTKILEKQCRAIIERVEEPDVLFDAGPGKIGTEAWILRKYWPNCIMVGIEPCIRRYNDIVYEYPGLIVNHAVTDEIGTINGLQGIGDELQGNDFTISCSDEDDSYYKKTTIHSVTIDHLDGVYGPFNKIFIWADIEGSESKLIQGAKEVLSEGRVIGLNLELTVGKDEHILDSLYNLGYKLSYRCMVRNENHGDYIFVKNI